jgi:superfamily I DNA/RNA helicase
VSEKLVANLYTWDDLCAGKSVGLQRIKDLYSSVPKQGQNAVVKRGSTQMLDLLAPDAELNMDRLQKEFGLLAGPEQSAYEVMRVGGAEQDYIDAMERRGDDLLSEPRIKLSTFHAMKGGEDDNCVVYLASTKACVESDYPDDEHRAFYVAVTRARHNLYILQSNNNYRYTI